MRSYRVALSTAMARCDVGGGDVEVGDQAQAVPAAAQHAGVAQPLDGAGGALGARSTKTILVCGGSSRHARQALQPLGQRAGVGMVVGQAVDVVVQRVQRGGGQHAGLAHAAAEPSCASGGRGR